MTHWISYSIAIPLFPVITALIFSFLKGEGIQYLRIFGGTELYMLSVILLAATRSDIVGSSDSRFKVGNYRRVTTLLVPGMLFSSVLYGIAFMNLRAENPDIPAMAIANLGILLGVSTFLFCGYLQFKLRSSSVKEVSP